MEIIRKNTVFRWLMPFFLGIVSFNVLRAVTDLTKDEIFWNGPFDQHVVSQLIVIAICYMFDIVWHRKLENKKYDISKQDSFIKEYLQIFFSMLVGINIVMFVCEKLGVIYMGNGFVDYMLANVVFIPIFLLYYTMIRSDVMNKNFTEQALLLEKVKNEKLDTELKYLKAQYHPHFLFNALNTIYFQTKEELAKKNIELLSELLRYQLYNVNKIVTMGQEINFIKSFILFQKGRMSERLVIMEEYDEDLNEQLIHPLLLQPLLENAFKYVRGEYWISLTIQTEGDEIHFCIENATDIGQGEENRQHGIGIENLKRRLELLYPNAHNLKLEQKVDSFLVELTINTGKNSDGN